MWSDALRGLTPARIQEILLVSSAYDAFVLDEDGPLADRLFGEYSELDLSVVPRITHASTATAALALLAQRRFELVFTVERIEDMEVAEFGRRVKEAHGVPVLLLVFDEIDPARAHELPPGIDRAFLWTGDSRTLLAAIKLTEDGLNVEHDTRTAGIPVIVVVEDRVAEWSRFLALLYPALLSQARALVGDALSSAQGVARMRVRPKVLLASSFDEALEIFARYRELVCALISDVEFPLASGRTQPRAGIALARAIRGEAPDLPMLLMSSTDHRADAEAIDAGFLDKRAADFAAGLARFLRDALGFGEFVFRLPDGSEVGRAANVFELEREVARVPVESIGYHAAGNHFSMWLKSRAMFGIAEQIRPRKLTEFVDLEHVRTYLIDVLRDSRARAQEGIISDFSARVAAQSHRFVRIGRGSVGGKGRGVAFLAALVKQHALLRRFEGIEVRVPRSVVIGTDVYDRTLETIDVPALERMGDAEILATLQAARLPADIEYDLREACESLRGPICVRSSSALEDSRHHPFAGVFATWMLAATADPDENFAQLCRAVMAVYASSFYARARAYAAATGQATGGKMAVIVQQVVGRGYGPRFYPQLSGVAQSYNYYPIGSQQADDGVAAIALGLGHQVVGGGTALRFSPGAPDVLPQFSTARAQVRGSQREFFAVDLAQAAVDFGAPPEASLSHCELDAAEADGTLALTASVYDPQDNVIRDSLARPGGARVITMSSILRWNAVPLPSTLLELLRLLRASMGGEVEIEFALDVAPALAQGSTPGLYLLQVRPLGANGSTEVALDFDAVDPDEVLCASRRALGHGIVDGLADVVYVTTADLAVVDARAIAREVGAINRELVAERRPYVLIGPGRWGTSDPMLGVPVDWTHIAGARVIVETPAHHRPVEPSQGTHFFHNLTSLRICYLSIDAADDRFDQAWLDALPARREHGHVRHVRLTAPLKVAVDGRLRRGIVLKHAAEVD